MLCYFCSTLFDYKIKHLFSSKRASYCLRTLAASPSHSVALDTVVRRWSVRPSVRSAQYGPWGTESRGKSSHRPIGGASWDAASATPDMLSEDPALQPPVLEPWWDGDGEGHPHPGMFETDRSVTQSRRNASFPFPRFQSPQC